MARKPFYDWELATTYALAAFAVAVAVGLALLWRLT